MKLVLRLLALSCLLWGGCGDRDSGSSAPRQPAAPSEPAPPAPVKTAPKQPSEPPKAAPAAPAVAPGQAPGPAPAPAPPSAPGAPASTQAAPPAAPHAPAAGAPAAKAPATPPPPAPVKPDVDARLEKLFPLPDVKPLETIVGNWENVPQKVVDAVRMVTVNTEAEYKLFANELELGSNMAPAGHRAKPLKYRPGQLLVTNSRDGNTKAVVNLEDTDFKDQVRALYNEQVDKGRRQVLGSRKAAKEALARLFPAGGEPPAGFGRPDSDARFKPAVDYLAAGKMIGHTMAEAKQWIWMGREKHERQDYDVVLVHFEVDTMFGPLPHPMKCLLKDGRVVKWIDAEFEKPE